MERLKDRLVDDWRHAWRWWTMRLNLVGSTLLAFLLAYPSALNEALKSLPPEAQAAVPWMVPAAWFALVTFARIHKQAPKGGGDGKGA